LIKVRKAKSQLKGIGVSLSLDKVRIKYSSFHCLGHFRFDAYKLDRFFNRNMLTESGSKAVVDGIIAIARNLKVSTIAEGVETKELLACQVDRCNAFQGYLFNPPLPL